jgi:hypothetical protein
MPERCAFSLASELSKGLQEPEFLGVQDTKTECQFLRRFGFNPANSVLLSSLPDARLEIDENTDTALWPKKHS